MDFNSEIAKIYPWLLNTARKYYSSMYDIEDLVGDTICKVLYNKDKFEDGRDLKPWCEIIMRNTYITNYNRKALIQFTTYDSCLDIYSDHSTSDNTIAYDVISAIKRCNDRSCCIECVIYYAEGYSYEEISKKLNIPIGTVRSRISWGRELLRKELKIYVK